MNEKRHENRAGHSRPALFPFITVRKERFGSIVFNPFLTTELELNAMETLIAELCTGAHTFADIRDQCCTEYGLSPEAADHTVDKTITRLNGLCALRFSKTMPESAGRLVSPPITFQDSLAWFSAPKAVIWDVTYYCNLRCPHCLTNSGRRRATELSTRDALRVVDRLAEAKVLRVSLAGGEPFLRPDLVAILKHIGDRNLSVDIASNGFDVPPRMFRALRNLPVFQVQVSVDGIGVAHDEFRGKTGAFESACHTLRRLKDEGVSTSISATATAKNVDHLADLIDLAADLGCQAFKAIPFIPAGRGKRNTRELWLGKEGALKLSRVLAEKSKALAGRMAVSTESSFTFLHDGPKPSRRGHDMAMTCSAGHDTLSLGADGTAYPCPFLHDFPLGNLLTDSMDRVWHDAPVLNDLRTLNQKEMTGACGTCEFAPGQCRGGCRAAAYLTCGTLKGSDPLCFKDLLAEKQQKKRTG